MVVGASSKGLGGDELREEARLSELGNGSECELCLRGWGYFGKKISPRYAQCIGLGKSVRASGGTNARLASQRGLPRSIQVEQVSIPAQNPTATLLGQDGVTR